MSKPISQPPFIVSDMTVTNIPRRINPELSPQGRSFRPSATIPGGEAISLDRWLRRRKYQGEGIYYDTGIQPEACSRSGEEAKAVLEVL